MKFTIAHYKRADSDWLVNGGRLIVEDGKYIVKYFFKTVAIFEAEKTFVRKIPDEMLYKGISISDGKQEYYLYFFKNVANEVYSRFKIVG